MEQSGSQNVLHQLGLKRDRGDLVIVPTEGELGEDFVRLRLIVVLVAHASYVSTTGVKHSVKGRYH